MEYFIHPRKTAGRAGFYPYAATFYNFSGTATDDDGNVGDYTAVTGLSSIPAALQVTPSTSSAPWERDVPSGEKLLLNGYYATIKKGQHVMVALGGWSKKYEVNDVEVCGIGTQMYITLVPIL